MDIEAQFSEFFEAIEYTHECLHYIPKFREFSVKILDGGCSYLNLKYCPFSGKKFPESLRDVWFDKIQALGLEPDDPSIPFEYSSDIWWQTL